MNGELGDERVPRRVFSALVAGAVVLGLAGWLVLRPHGRGAPAPSPPARFVTLVAPRGELDAAPTLFEWQTVEGASRYTVKIEDADAVWPLFVRSTASPSLSLEPDEVSALRPGRVHVWEVQAFDEKGNLIASGGTSFRVRMPTPPPS